jgi:hypothetical protein
VLPETIRRRPKAPLAGDPLMEHWRDQTTRERIRSFVPKRTSKYVVPAAFSSALDSSMAHIWTNLRPLSLEYWLRWANVSVI